MGEEFILRVAVGVVLALLAGVAVLALVGVGHLLAGARRLGGHPSAGDPGLGAMAVRSLAAADGGPRHSFAAPEGREATRPPGGRRSGPRASRDRRRRGRAG